MTDDHDERPPWQRQPQLARDPLAVVGLTPRLQEALVALSQSASAQLPAIQLIARQFSDEYAALFADLAQVTVPKGELFNITLPPLKLDYQSLFPDLDNLSTQLLDQLEPAFRAIREMQRAQFARAFASLAKLGVSIWPPNWRGVGVPAEEILGGMLLDEGLCLAWLPPAAILGRLFTAGTPQQRRRIIGGSWRRIALAARDELEQVTAPGLGASCLVRAQSR